MLGGEGDSLSSAASNKKPACLPGRRLDQVLAAISETEQTDVSVNCSNRLGRNNGVRVTVRQVVSWTKYVT
ncbi:hypothetical protein NC653_019526 [Populus alba x Populus x berolinensis]|uniref:Uncharacterized protein n=1 Tax=Populus alba x Populus x berolinensis TaxID=444605 RepID=A0AAD6QJ43_9ROSI|nr:hypothetical protein NC653_019526 [Populus alba x Populus x berolinensis]